MQLYQEHVNPSAKHEDLFDAQGNYRPVNKYNRDSVNGAMHLIQRNNTLQAEIELGAAATILRQAADGRLLSGEQVTKVRNI